MVVEEKVVCVLDYKRYTIYIHDVRNLLTRTTNYELLK